MRSVRTPVVALFAIALMAFPLHEAKAQGKGKGGAARVGGAKATAKAPVTKVAGKAIANKTIANKAQGPVGKKANFPNVVNPVRGVSGYTGGGYGPYGNGRYAVQPGGIFILGGLDPGYIPFSNGGTGFSPYVLQGFNNWAPSVYSTPPQNYNNSLFVEPPVNNNVQQQFPAIVGNGQKRTTPIEIGPAPRAATATVQIVVPTENAELWFNGAKMQTPGQQREFLTPELPPGQTFTYEVRVRWTMNGQNYEQTRTVTVQAGSQTVLNFLTDQREQLPLPMGIKI